AVSRFETRLSQLEDTLRDLTGKLEEISYANEQTRRQLDKMTGDMELRFADLEKGRPGQPPAQAQGQAPAAPPAPSQSAGNPNHPAPPPRPLGRRPPGRAAPARAARRARPPCAPAAPGPAAAGPAGRPSARRLDPPRRLGRGSVQVRLQHPAAERLRPGRAR